MHSTNGKLSGDSPTCQFIPSASSNLHRHLHDINHSHSHSGGHGHSHEAMESPGSYRFRPRMIQGRRFDERAFTVGIAGPVGSGKTALMLKLCRALAPAADDKSPVSDVAEGGDLNRRSDRYNIACVTNDIFTREDCEYLIRNQALDDHERIVAVETGGCPHAAIREDISANLQALETLQRRFHCDMLLIESGGDNLAANYSRELADFIVYVIDVAGGDKVPRKGGPGITQSDLLVINKTDLAEAVGANLSVMERDALRMRDGGPIVFAQVKVNRGVDEIVEHILAAYKEAIKLVH